MRLRHRPLALCGLALGAALAAAPAAQAQAQAQATVTVTFPGAERYADAGDGPRDTQATLKALEQHLRELGRRLPAGQRLSVAVTALDLAGRVLPSTSRASPARLLEGAADWPRAELRYTLAAADGTLLQQGSVALDDKTYLQRPLIGSDPLRYEKRMLTQWFVQQFGIDGPPPR